MIAQQATDLPEDGPGLTWSDLEQWADEHPNSLLMDPLWAVRQVCEMFGLVILSMQLRLLPQRHLIFA